MLEDSPTSMGSRLKTARLSEGLSQQQVADRVNVTQATVSSWERGKTTPRPAQLEHLNGFLNLDPEETDAASELSAFGEWLGRTRREQQLTRRELADRAGISEVQIGNIERGETRNPRHQTKKRLQEALQVKVPAEVEKETIESVQIPGLGALQDFDPHDANDWPSEPGVYVFYDISDRPVYVGKSGDISSRLRDHEERFWYKKPIVQSASFIRVENEKLRHQLEQVLIKFLKSNAVINQQSVRGRST